MRKGSGHHSLPEPERYKRGALHRFGRCCGTSYIGEFAFGTVKVRNPETGRKTSKARPKEEWEHVGVPKLRIVTEDLWNAVHARIKQMNANLGAARLGGMNRTTASRSYLFSGLLVCGECTSRLVIISGRGKRGVRQVWVSQPSVPWRLRQCSHHSAGPAGGAAFSRPGATPRESRDDRIHSDPFPGGITEALGRHPAADARDGGSTS
jgi:hypothetical protein